MDFLTSLWKFFTSIVIGLVAGYIVAFLSHVFLPILGIQIAFIFGNTAAMSLGDFFASDTLYGIIGIITFLLVVSWFNKKQ
ncbi:hypothetical protein ACFL1Y_00120 [Patescibacteria group bacterium]